MLARCNHIDIPCNDSVRRLTQWIKKMMKNFFPLRSYPMMHRLVITVAVAIFMAGCASIPAPTEQMAISRAAINNASSAGANELAPQQLKFAMEKMGAAEQAMTEKDYVRARQLAEQAQVDAQLAEATAAFGQGTESGGRIAGKLSRATRRNRT
jgi:hypothetical protein